MLQILKNVQVTRKAEDEGCPEFTKMIFSVVPTEVHEEEYDFSVSLNDPEKGFLGFEGENLAVIG